MRRTRELTDAVGLRRRASFFERLEREHHGHLQTGLATLRSWLDSERRPSKSAEARRHLRDGSVIAWQSA